MKCNTNRKKLYVIRKIVSKCVFYIKDFQSRDRYYIFLFLYNRADADQSLAQTGLGLVGLGFLGFFISYGLRAWLRFGPGAKSREE